MQLRHILDFVKKALNKVELNVNIKKVPGRRNLSDVPKNLDSKTKQIVVKGTISRHALITRRVRPTDVPRVLRFVREQARQIWPSEKAPPVVAQMVLNDYVSRILAQGHSMVTEQLEVPYGWNRIRGLALATGYTRWDAETLRTFSHCLKSLQAKKLIEFTAHCLRAPGLHEKYKVHNVLQVILVVPESEESERIANALIKGTIKRGRDVGYPIVRFDVNNETLVSILEKMKLNKEWHIDYQVLHSKIIENKEKLLDAIFLAEKGTNSTVADRKSPFISVYSAVTEKPSI